LRVAGRFDSYQYIDIHHLHTHSQRRNDQPASTDPLPALPCEESHAPLRHNVRKAGVTLADAAPRGVRFDEETVQGYLPQHSSTSSENTHEQAHQLIVRMCAWPGAGPDGGDLVPHTPSHTWSSRRTGVRQWLDASAHRVGRLLIVPRKRRRTSRTQARASAVRSEHPLMPTCKSRPTNTRISSAVPVKE
jgi:hypothetical protein